MVSRKYINFTLLFLATTALNGFSQKRLATPSSYGLGYNSAILAEIIYQEFGDSVLVHLNETEPRGGILIDYLNDSIINNYSFFGRNLPELLKNKDNQELIISRLKKVPFLYCVPVDAHLGYIDLGETTITIMFDFIELWTGKATGLLSKKKYDIKSIKQQIDFFKNVYIQSMDEYVLEKYLKLLKDDKNNERRRKIFLEYIKKNICKCSDIDE